MIKHSCIVNIIFCIQGTTMFSTSFKCMLVTTIYCYLSTMCCIPWKTFFSTPPQCIQPTTSCRTCAEMFITWASIHETPLQFVQVTTCCRIRARIFVPWTSNFSTPPFQYIHHVKKHNTTSCNDVQWLIRSVRCDELRSQTILCLSLVR